MFLRLLILCILWRMSWQFNSLGVLLETKLRVSFHYQQYKEYEQRRQKRIHHNDNIKQIIFI